MDDRVRLGVGDAAVVAAVVIAGQLSHGVNPLAAPLSSAETLLPFVAGWLVAAGLVGVYRASPLFSGGITWPFPLVITGTTLGALLLWRGALVALTRVRRPTGRPAGD